MHVSKQLQGTVPTIYTAVQGGMKTGRTRPLSCSLALLCKLQLTMNQSTRPSGNALPQSCHWCLRWSLLLTTPAVTGYSPQITCAYWPNLSKVSLGFPQDILHVHNSSHNLKALCAVCCAVATDDLEVKGPGNGIVNGLVQVRKGPLNGAGARSNCKAWNSLHGHITAGMPPGEQVGPLRH
jgi:hypothetical protein